MVFGLGRKKDQAAAPTQMSPEALAMLNQLAQAAPTGMAQAPAMAQPAGAAPTMPSGAGMTQFPTLAAVAPSVETTGIETTGVELTAKDQRKLAREEKKAAAIAKREEKDISRRRKRNAKARFSRAQYLREADGNATSSVALAGFLLAITIIIPLVVNALFLLPATRSNQEIIEEVRSLKSLVDQAQPILQAAIAKKKEREATLQTKLAAFSADEQATAALRKLVSDLETRGAVMKTSAAGTVVNTDVGLPGVAGKSMTVEMKVDFLDYLLVRNRFVRSQSSVNVAEETIVATPGDPIVDVKLVLLVPARS